VATILAPAPSTPAQTGREREPRFTVSYGAGAGMLAAAVGLAMLSAVTVLLWATGPETTGRSTGPFRTAAALWILGQRGSVEFPGTEVRLAPLGLAAAFALVAAKAAGWAVRRSRAHDLASAARVVGGFVGGSAVAAYVAARLTADFQLHVGLWSALSAVLPFALVWACVGAIPQTYGWAVFAARRRARWRPILRSALAAGTILFAGGAVVVAAALFVRSAATGDLFALTGGGFSGALGTLMLCIVLLPTAACWAIAFAAGPGFALGTDASVALSGVHSGALPSLPIFGAVPEAGGLPWFGWLPPVLVVLAGVAAGWYRPAGFVRLRSAVAAAAAAGALAGLGAGLVLAFSSGDAGGRLSTIGPDGLTVGGVLAAELAAAAAATALLRHLTSPRLPDPNATVPAPRAAADDSGSPVAAGVGESPGQNVPRVVPVLLDDPHRWDHLLPGRCDIEDTVELPVVRRVPTPIVDLAPAPAEVVDDEPLLGRWARAKALLRSSGAVEPVEDPSPAAAEAMSVAQAVYSGDLAQN
jgi:hypothetical protein